MVINILESSITEMGYIQNDIHLGKSLNSLMPFLFESSCHYCRICRIRICICILIIPYKGCYPHTPRVQQFKLLIITVKRTNILDGKNRTRFIMNYI